MTAGQPVGGPLMPGGLPALSTKLVAPPMRPGIIQRRSLVARLASLRTPIVAVIAPAGYGKSTAVAQWAAQDRRPVGWLSIDARDNDPYLLLGYLFVALDGATALADDARMAIASGGSSIWTSAVPRLGAAVAAGGEVVLVLDDFDRISDLDAADAILALADHLPPGSQLVLIGRGEGRLPMSRLLAADRVAVVGASDLVFDLDETATILRDVGVDLPAPDIARLTAHLEGWPAGVYLTARSIGSGDLGPPTATEPATGLTSGVESSVTHLAGEYIRSELLAGLDEDDVRFALRTSVLERLTGALCDAVLGRTDSAARLLGWERSNLFLIPLDRDHAWYRYHHLLHEVLVAELKRQEPGAVEDLNRRAAVWHLDQGLHEQAFEYFVAAKEDEAAARLLPGLLQRAWNTGRAETGKRWADWFEGSAAFDRHVAPLAVGSFMFRHLGEAARADRWSDTADRWRPDPTDPAAAHGEALRHLGRAFAMRSGPELMLDDARRAVEPLERTDPWLISALAVLGVAEYVNGLDDEATETLDDAVGEALARSASPTAAAIAAAVRADLAMGREDWATAIRMVESGRGMVTANHLGEHSPGIAIDAVAARLAVHLGDREAAQGHIAHSQRIRPVLNHAIPWLAVRTRLDLATAHLGLSDPAGARTLLLEIRNVMIRRPKLGRLSADVTALESRLGQMPGGSTSASTLTVAELRVLPLLSTHLSFQEIADRLFVSRNTVKTQALSIYRKLDATSRSEAVDHAARAGLIDQAH